MKKYQHSIKKFTKIIESNKSIYTKIIAYKFRGLLYLYEELFTEQINEQIESKGKGKLKDLIYTKNTWEVS